MEVVLSVCAVVITICIIFCTINAFDESNRRRTHLTALNTTIYRISQHLAHISDHTGRILDDPAKLAILLLKDSFLSRKDRDEGIMLVEAVEKQLKKKSRKVEHPVS